MIHTNQHHSLYLRMLMNLPFLSCSLAIKKPLLKKRFFENLNLTI